MIAIKATILLTLAAGTLGTRYSPYYNYRVSYGQGSPYGAYPVLAAPAVVSAPSTGIQGYPAVPATLAAYHGTPTGIHTYHATPAAAAAIRAVPSYSPYHTASAFSRFYEGAHNVVAPARTTKLAPGYSTYPSAQFAVPDFFSVPNGNNVSPYHAATPAYTYQYAPPVSRPYFTPFLGIPGLTGVTRVPVYQPAPAFATYNTPAALARNYRSAHVAA